MRQFLSKSIAGGLSAGVVLLWWPIVFAEVDSVTSWLVRGVAWTVCFELLLLALAPFERALWETRHGERISNRVGAAGSRLHAGSGRRRLSRLSALAAMALAVPVALLVTGLAEHAPARAEAAPVRPVKVVHVTKVVKVRRVVHPAPVSVSAQPVAPAAPSRPSAPASPEPPASRPDRVVVGRSAPEQGRSTPAEEAEVPEPAPAPAPSF